MRRGYDPRYGVHQGLDVERLRQKFSGARIHAFLPQTRRVVGGDDDDWTISAGHLQGLLDFYARHIRHLQVEYQAIRPSKMPGLEKVLAGGEGGRGKARCPQHANHGTPY